ncbi:MAG: DUF222 domain-containing protein, partial [Sporichthyaceae bacterium]|nr:DUF222 domain-containing protein [Sporichthyaceae bacterium]
LGGARDALAAGRLDLGKLRVLANATRSLTDEQAGIVEGQVLARAPHQVLGDFKQSVNRALLRVDSTATEKRHERCLADRKVELIPLADGIAGIWATMRADAAVALFEGLTALAHKAKDSADTRNLDQRRSDVLADIGEHLLARHDLPRRHGRRPHLQVTVGAGTLLGLDQEPGELAGYGPIPAAVARELAGDATWRRLLVDPQSGTLLDYGTSVYSPPQSLADKVIAKHGRCRRPGCRMPAARCHLDHTQRFPEGPTAEHNLGPLCQPDHLCKHEPGWFCEQHSDGTYLWTTPTGHQYLDPLRPVLEPATGPPGRTSQARPDGLDPPPF